MSDAASGVTYSRLIMEALTRFGDRTAFMQEGRTYTYAQAADLVGRMRAVLARPGIGLGSGVGVLSPNRAEMWLSQAAAWLAGARCTGLHPLGSEDDHVFVCDDAELEVLVVDPAVAERAAAIAARSQTLKQLFTLGPADVGEDLLALSVAAEPERLDPGPAGEEDLVFLKYTGGTTGRPKGVMYPHRAMVQSLSTAMASWQLPDAPRFLVASPMTHTAGLLVLPTLLRGGTVLLHQAFDPERWLRTVADEGVSYTFVVPTMIYALLDHGAPERYDLSSLQTVVYGASPMSPARLVEAHERIGPVFCQIYGQAECLAGTSLFREEHDPIGRPELLASCGRPMVGVEVAVLDDAHQEVPVGEVGEICMRSRAVMNGYWHMPEATSEALAGGWLHTADMARQDDQGYLYIVDRKKDMIISGGFNVYPKEVEDVLATHPDVSRSAVIGVPDERWGEAVKAVVVARPGAELDPATLIALVKVKKGSHHAPKTVDVVDDLPVTPVGKVDKKVLRARYWAGQDRQVH